MGKPIPTNKQVADTSNKKVVTTKKPATHTLNKQATLTLHNPLHLHKPMEGDSNRGGRRIDTIKVRQRMVATLLIQPVQGRRAVAMVRSMLRTILDRGLIVTSWRKRCRDDTYERANRRIRSAA